MIYVYTVQSGVMCEGVKCHLSFGVLILQFRTSLETGHSISATKSTFVS